MLVGAGGGGFEVPQGDPGTLHASAGRLRSIGGTLRQAAGSVRSQASAVTGSWSGPAASSFDTGAGGVVSGLHEMAGHHDDAAGAIEAYAAALSDAQHRANQAILGYQRAVDGYQATMGQLAAAPATAAARAAQAAAEDRAGADLQAAYTAASTACAHAVSDANHAATACANRLSELASGAKDTALHRFLDLLGGPGTALGALGVLTQVRSADKMWGLLRDMGTGNWESLAKADPAEYQKVLDVASQYGADSPEALAAQLRYEAQVADEAWGAVVSAAVPANAVPSGAMAGTLDVLGKVGLVTAVVGDVGTLVDGRASGLDKAMAGANLAGVSMVGADTEFVTDLLGANVVADWVPGVGEVLIAGTAVYFAQEWVRANWGDITRWTSEGARALARGMADLGHLEIQAGGDVLHAGEVVGSHVVSGIESAGSRLVGSAESVGSQVANDLQDAGSVFAGLLP